jgi:hypothetical protein
MKGPTLQLLRLTVNEDLLVVETESQEFIIRLDESYSQTMR